MDAADVQAIGLSIRLASLTTILLLLLGTPLAWWLARSRSSLRHVVRTVVALPLVLPPTVIGFYMLVLLGPEGSIGRLTTSLGIGLLPFSFTGLVIASMLYSLPFVVQPLHNAFESIGRRPLEVAATLRASPLDSFWAVALPLANSGYLTATVMGFAHTVGEFGVVLMIGGNIPGKTRVVSIQIYDYVETLDFDHARVLAFVMLAFSCLALFTLYVLNPTDQERSAHHG